MEPLVEEKHVVAVDKKGKNRYSLNEKGRDNIFQQISIDSQPDAYYYIMVVLSCSVATYGLLSNSTAVIIGAMLIAPLMNPILGGALALITGSNKLLKVTMKAEFIGAGIAIVLSTLLTLLLPVSELTPEILARTEPTLIDLIIALASGAAGTYAICYRQGATLPGVAIATALMPPLCVVGISLAKQEFQLAAGALLLFLANMVAIIVIGILIFKIAGFKTPSISNYLGIHLNEEKETFFSRIVQNKIIYPVTLLILICIPLLIFMSNSITADRTQKLIKSSLEEGLMVLAPYSKIISVDFEEVDGAYEIATELNTEQVIYPEDIRSLENSLEYKMAAPVRLHADVTLVQKVSNESSTNAFQTLFPQAEEKIVEVLETRTPEEIIEQMVMEKLSLFEGAVLQDFEFTYKQGSGTYSINLYIYDGPPLDPQFAQSLENILEDKLKRKVYVLVKQDFPVVEEELDVEQENEISAVQERNKGEQAVKQEK